MGMLSYTSSVCVSFSLCLAFSDTIFFVQTHTHVQWDTSPGVRRLQQASQIISTSLGPPTCGWKGSPLWPVDCLWFLPAHLSICLPVFCVCFFFLFFLTLLGLHTCWFSHLLHFLSFCFFLSVWTCWYVSLSLSDLFIGGLRREFALLIAHCYKVLPHMWLPSVFGLVIFEVIQTADPEVHFCPLWGTWLWDL